MTTEHLPPEIVDACAQGMRSWFEPCLHADLYCYLPSFPSIGIFCGRRAFERLQIEVDRARLIDQFRD
jgi:hypothetical protein